MKWHKKGTLCSLIHHFYNLYTHHNDFHLHYKYLKWAAYILVICQFLLHPLQHGLCYGLHYSGYTNLSNLSLLIYMVEAWKRKKLNIWRHSKKNTGKKSHDYGGHRKGNLSCFIEQPINMFSCICWCLAPDLELNLRYGFTVPVLPISFE